MGDSLKRKRRRAVASREGADAGLPEESWFSALESAPEAGPRDRSASGHWGLPNPVLRPLAGHALRRIFGTYVAARAALGVALMLAIMLMGAASGRYLSAPLSLVSGYVVQAF